VSLLLALPRPKILRKVLAAVASMGVKRLVLVGTWRVEKSYFASPLLAAEAMESELRLGLEQGRDTILPEVLVRRHFKPLVEDELDALFPSTLRLLAHAAAGASVEDRPVLAPTPAPLAALAVGPEGGFTEYETGALVRRGFAPVSLGPRPLRVDVAVPFAVAQVEMWLRRGHAPA
jgi:RsmE family RNA methyltransferase